MINDYVIEGVGPVLTFRALSTKGRRVFEREFSKHVIDVDGHRARNVTLFLTAEGLVGSSSVGSSDPLKSVDRRTVRNRKRRSTAFRHVMTYVHRIHELVIASLITFVSILVAFEVVSTHVHKTKPLPAPTTSVAMPGSGSGSTASCA
jgi:hypothetical protein